MNRRDTILTVVFHQLIPPVNTQVEYQNLRIAKPNGADIDHWERTFTEFWLNCEFADGEPYKVECWRFHTCEVKNGGYIQDEVVDYLTRLGYAVSRSEDEK